MNKEDSVTNNELKDIETPNPEEIVINKEEKKTNKLVSLLVDELPDEYKPNKRMWRERIFISEEYGKFTCVHPKQAANMILSRMNRENKIEINKEYKIYFSEKRNEETIEYIYIGARTKLLTPVKIEGKEKMLEYAQSVRCIKN